jgi:hypothetical protein
VKRPADIAAFIAQPFAAGIVSARATTIMCIMTPDPRERMRAP